MFDIIQKNCAALAAEFDQIPIQRKEQLKQLSAYLTKKILAGETPKVIVICTHNSRRSHLGQLWLEVGRDYYELPRLESYSGGTAATALHPNIVGALESLGFGIQSSSKGNNPTYELAWGKEHLTAVFSKKYDATSNPRSNFAAVMVCESADQNCPLVLGMDFRLALPYNDPKVYDGTAEVSRKYLEKAKEIGREMLYVTHQTKEQLKN